MKMKILMKPQYYFTLLAKIMFLALSKKVVKILLKLSFHILF